MFEDVPQAVARSYQDETARNRRALTIPSAPKGAGFAAHVRLATPMGWRPTHGLRAGDEVFTLDGGTQIIRDVLRQPVWSAAEPCPANLWPYLVPAGALGNTGALSLTQGQHVLFEEEAALEMFGAFLVAVPVTELEGYFGIQRIAPVGRLDLVFLIMDQNEVLMAEGGAMVLCPAGQPGGNRSAGGDPLGAAGHAAGTAHEHRPPRADVLDYAYPDDAASEESIEYPVLQPAHCESLLDELEGRGSCSFGYSPEPDYAASTSGPVRP